MDRFDKFTDRARKVLTLAQDEAQRFNHNYIGTEHLLLGLVREGEGVAARVLAALGHDTAGVDALCERTGLAADAIAVALVELELSGKIAPLPGGAYQRLR